MLVKLLLNLRVARNPRIKKKKKKPKKKCRLVARDRTDYTDCAGMAKVKKATKRFQKKQHSSGVLKSQRSNTSDRGNRPKRSKFKRPETAAATDDINDGTSSDEDKNRNELDETEYLDTIIKSQGGESDDESLTGESNFEGFDPSSESDSDIDVDQKKEIEQKIIDVSHDTIIKWKIGLNKEHSTQTLKTVVRAFKDAVFVDDREDEQKVIQKYFAVTDANSFNELVSLALEDVPAALEYSFPISQKKNKPDLSKPEYSKLTSTLKSFLISVTHLLQSFSDGHTLAFTLRSSEKILPYVLSFRKLLKNYYKAVCDVWSSGPDDNSRISAFLAIRKLCQLDKSSLDQYCKLAYNTLLLQSRNTSSRTIPQLNFLKNTLSELLALDQKIAYQFGFKSIRKLAIDLRAVVAAKSGETNSMETIYSWQFYHALDFWSKVINRLYDPKLNESSRNVSPTRALIYPLVQVSLGTLRLSTSSTYFPYRFLILRTLLKLSEQTRTLVPVMPYINEVLESSEMKRKPKPSTLKPLDFFTCIRAPSSYLKTRVYQQGLMNEIIELIQEYYYLYAKSIAFPELSVPASVLLKRYAKKESSNVELSKNILSLVEKLDENEKFILSHRNNVTFGPLDHEACDNFINDIEVETTPFGKYVTIARKKRDEIRQMLAQSEDHGKNASNNSSEDEDYEDLYDTSEEEIEYD